MATDLESGKQEGEVVPLRPSLKITGLHIKGLKSIGSLDLPEDGLGWKGEIPNFVMVGGINGSGKTTLLEFLVSAFELAVGFSIPNANPLRLPPALSAEEARIDFLFGPMGQNSSNVRFLIGNHDFISQNERQNCCGFVYSDDINDNKARQFSALNSMLPDYARHMRDLSSLRNSGVLPHIVFFPSERRTLISPVTNYKFAGKLSYSLNFVDRWQPPENWDDSLEARLYGIRWEDLNAREEGRDSEANGFEAYSTAFARFFESRKRLRWHNAELVVETKKGDIHSLNELSSGEKQVILFMGELLHRWRPGSLILIDEPELHLHESYQTKLWEALVDWQRERGGQVIVATQSAHLFGISDPGIKVLLSARRAQ